MPGRFLLTIFAAGDARPEEPERGFAVPATLDQQIDTLIARYAELAADGLTWPEGVQLGKEFTAAAMKIAADLNEPGANKRAFVLAAVRKFSDVILSSIDLPFLPWWLRLALPWIRPILAQALTAIAEAWLEKTYLERFAA